MIIVTLDLQFLLKPPSELQWDINESRHIRESLN
jgi:hypothetical protein